MSSFLLIKSNNPSVQAQTNVNSAQWEQFTVREGGFSVFLPRRSKETIEPVGMGAGAGNLHNFFVELQNSTYGISYADFPNISGDLNACNTGREQITQVYIYLDDKFLSK